MHTPTSRCRIHSDIKVPTQKHLQRKESLMHYKIVFKKNPNIMVIHVQGEIRSGWDVCSKREVEPRKRTLLSLELLAIDGISGIFINPLCHRITVEKKTNFDWTEVMFLVICCIEKNLVSKRRHKKFSSHGQSIVAF